jgi:nucleoside-diphosphate-sugar epimerase
VPAVPEPRRAFVTGALGFIGRALSRRLRDRGIDVRGMDVRAEPDLGVVAGDVAAEGEWQRHADGCDLVIHTAAIVSMRPDPGPIWEVNVLGTRRALDAARGGGARRFVHLSSITAFSFDYPDGVSELHPIRPNGVPYVDTKVASEQVVLQAHAAGELPCTIVRPGDVYGPGSMPWTVWPVEELARGRLLLPAFGRGVISPVFVDNLVDGILLAGQREEGAGQVFTITDGVGVTTGDFFGHYARLLDRPLRRAPTWLARMLAAAAMRLPGDTEVSPAAVEYIARRGTYSIEKARTLLGYEPDVDLAEGMRRTTEWLRAEGYV